MLKLLLLLNLSLVCFMVKSIDSANILVIEGTPSPSHHIWMRTLMIGLAARGHNVTSISSDIDKNTVPNLHYIHLENTYSHLYNGSEKINYIEAGDMNSVSSLFFFASFRIKSCEGMLSSKGIKALLNYPKSFEFEIILHDNIVSPCLSGFVHKFGYPPLIHVSAFPPPAVTGQWAGSQFYSYIKPFFRMSSSDSFLGRVQNLALYFAEYMVKEIYVYPKINGLSKKVFPTAPPLVELESRVKLVLTNSHPVTEIVEPLLPNVIPVGGLQIRIPDELPNDLKNIADLANDGLVLFSLGTNVRSDMLGNERLTIILEAFRSFPRYTFIWKFESGTLPVTVPRNVHIRAWVPQNEILAHANTILFVTHSGLLSTQEAVWYGVPMLCLPVFADQNANSELVKRANIAELIPVRNINSTNLKEALSHMFDNLSKYRKNANKLSKSFRDQPELPLHRAMWWIEWLLRHPDTEYLNSPAKDLNIFARHGFDVILFLIVVLFISIHVPLKIVCTCIRWLRRPKQNNKVKKN